MPISHAPALRAIIGTGLYMIVLGVFAMSLGALTRNTAGGIAIFAGVLFVLPGLVHVLPASTFDAINPYLPSNAGSDVLSNTTDPGMLAPWTRLCGVLRLRAAYACRLGNPARSGVTH